MGGERSSGREQVVGPAWVDGGREVAGSLFSFLSLIRTQEPFVAAP